MQTVPVGDFTELVFHVLAHLQTEGPENLWAPRYAEWVRGTLDARTEAEWARARSALESIARVPGGLRPMQVWPELFESIEQLMAAPAEFEQLGEADVRDGAALGWLYRDHFGAAACFYTALRTMAPSFGPWHAAQIVERRAAALAAEGEAWAEIESLAPSLAATRVERSLCLGGHGRAFTSRIIVGVSTEWAPLDPHRPVVVALHEHHVAQVDSRDYFASEWTALVELSGRIAKASPALRLAHAQWLASLDLSGLIATVVARGQLQPALGQRLSAQSFHRGVMLAAIAAEHF